MSTQVASSNRFSKFRLGGGRQEGQGMVEYALILVLVSIVVIVTPGPDTALIIRNAIAGGPRASTMSALGVAVGILAWAGAATLGVGVLLERSSTAFTILKLAGAAYLFYLGKSLTGPFPRDVLSVPVLGTVCLLSSSVTVAVGVRDLARGAVGRSVITFATMVWTVGPVKGGSPTSIS